MENHFVEIRYSKIHGNGGFAKRKIKKGRRIIEYIGTKVTKKQAEKISGKAGIFLFELDDKWDIDGSVPENTARFINHSCDPNCTFDIVGRRIWIKAKRNIKKGEELSYNYGFDLDGYEEYPCKCGAKNCVGYILDKDNWKKLGRQKVLVAMSGGVDSSVAALLMKNEGHEVVGAFMKNWSDTKNDMGECTWRGERRMALKVAAMLKIPLITLDFEKEYRKLVVEEMYKKYRKGITPNPDIDCNDKVKFPLLIKAAKKLKCDSLVTGHYARIKRTYGSSYDISLKNGSKFKLLRAKDELKDQSYFLYRLKQKELAMTQFPIGEYTKQEVREIARKNKFPNYDKKSTVGICFIGKVNLKKFLQKKIKSKLGKILDPQGNVIGEHDGIYYYTIGQRIGSRYGIEVSKAGDDKKQIKKWYVARKYAKTNVIVAAPEGHPLNFRKEIYLKDVYWINGNPLGDDKIKDKNSCLIKNKYANRVSLSGRWFDGNNSLKVLSRIRQVGELLDSKISYSKNKIHVSLKKAITGVSEGQAIVLYKGTEVLGGGVIGFS